MLNDFIVRHKSTFSDFMEIYAYSFATFGAISELHSEKKSVLHSENISNYIRTKILYTFFYA
jgi:hypothetical protein